MHDSLVSAICDFGILRFRLPQTLAPSNMRMLYLHNLNRLPYAIFRDRAEAEAEAEAEASVPSIAH
jgi:hypothetical protein